MLASVRAPPPGQFGCTDNNIPPGGRARARSFSRSRPAPPPLAYKSSTGDNRRRLISILSLPRSLARTALLLYDGRARENSCALDEISRFSRSVAAEAAEQQQRQQQLSLIKRRAKLITREVCARAHVTSGLLIEMRAPD